MTYTPRGDEQLWIFNHSMKRIMFVTLPLLAVCTFVFWVLSQPKITAPGVVCYERGVESGEVYTVDASVLEVHDLNWYRFGNYHDYVWIYTERGAPTSGRKYRVRGTVVFSFDAETRKPPWAGDRHFLEETRRWRR